MTLKKINFKNVAVLSLLQIALFMMVFYDYLSVQNDFKALKTRLINIRMETISNDKILTVKFDEKKISISNYQTGQEVDSFEISTLNNVHYDTKLGKNMIVFDKGTTERFNIRIHGGEISLRSWFGFRKYIHINCAGYVREGRYPED